MQLKKINLNLQKALVENGLVHANELQFDTFSTIKSGADCVIASPRQSGKTTLLVINTIQKLQRPEGESTRALFVTQDKETVLELVELFEKYGQYTGLRVIGSHEKGDIDYDKNQISLGMDVLIGTPARINALFSSAGFNLTTIRFFVVDDADILFKNRQDSVILRLAESVTKTQFVFTCAEITERVEIIAGKIMTEPVFFEPENEGDGYGDEEE